MQVRMKRFVPQFVFVLDLELGRVYEIADERAKQLIDNDMAEPVARGGIHSDPDVEAATLKPAQRRG